MTLTYGSLFAGYGGLDMGVQSVLPGETAWVSEFDPAPSKILAHHWPDTPNLGDITKVDFTQAPPIDVLTGGFPCQDVSHAGRRAGLIRDGEGRTRSGLWGHMLRAITETKPRLVVAENVRGLLSAQADSDMEQCPFCMGDSRDGVPVLRALGAVLGDLADIGFDARWYGLRAADVGAPHGRFRIFLFATPAANAGRGGGLEAVKHDGRGTQVRDGAGVPHQPDRDALRVGSERDLTLLPTPAVNDMGASYTPETWDAWTAKMQAAHGNGNGHGKSLSIEAQRLLPTPRAESRWGDYAPAIARWEAVLGRPAPEPTEPTPQSKQRLSADFVCWLMGLPEGHVTDPDIGLTRNQQLKALGNGVVPAQAAAATSAFIHDLAKEPAA